MRMFERLQVNPEVQRLEQFANETRVLFNDIVYRYEQRENPLTPWQIEILEKVLLKLELKRNLENTMRYADDTSKYQKMKKLGVLLVFDREANTQWESANKIFALKKGDQYIDVHLPPISKEKRIDLFTQAKHSFELLACYIKEQNLNPKYVMGVTYEKLAGVAIRYGFETLALDIPEDIREGVERVYTRFREPKDGESMGKILLCFQTKEDFLARFGV
ncbi:MAG: hypothetical protein K9L98_00845 [Candidatus Pacebacteria bacterium]|nr:hypothetical protein [Candidatus Paceibacterota bacterium]MCF7862543.1 hypothetical protein [Candidatus Paceibacterota bacterium]